MEMKQRLNVLLDEYETLVAEDRFMEAREVALGIAELNIELQYV